MLLKKSNVPALLDLLAADRAVFVPAVVDGVAKYAQYAPGSDMQPAFELVNTTLPPKDLLFPQTQKMYHYSVDEEGNYRIDAIDESRPQAVFGIRPCDMRSIALLDDVFTTKGFGDEFYENLRNKLLTVCIGCTAPAETCFCDSMGLDPNNAPNADVMLNDAGDAYVVTTQTEVGEAEVAKWAELVEDGDAEPASAECTLKVNSVGLKEKLDGMFDAALWDEVSIKCLNCGTCTYECPTCYCFDISQEKKMKEGTRFRCWDSCMFSEYTAMAGGHNPRPTKKERVRNRFMHKLNYFEDRYGKMLCVGCGRCVADCPVALDITRLIDEIGEWDA